jgi:hypothetical protein
MNKFIKFSKIFYVGFVIPVTFHTTRIGTDIGFANASYPNDVISIYGHISTGFIIGITFPISFPFFNIFINTT